LLVVGTLALVGHALLFFLARRMTKRISPALDDTMVTHVRRPTRVVFVCMVVLITLPTLPLSAHALAFLRHLGALAFIAATAWTIVALINVVNDLALTKYRLDVSDNLLARQFHTRFRLLRRVVFIILGILAGSSALMTFQSVRQLGVSLLASAGLTGLVIGMAARPTLSNVLAGIQLAFAEPIGGPSIILYRETVPKLDTRVR
jgi:small-conductance mechanosensitive channel